MKSCPQWWKWRRVANLVAGSVDFLTSGCHGNQGRHGGRGHLRGRGSRDQRRNQRMMNMGGNDLESTPNQQTGLFFLKKSHV